jgi:hypothetical protein
MQEIEYWLGAGPATVIAGLASWKLIEIGIWVFKHFEVTLK